MKLSHLSDEVLLSETKRLVKEEQALLVQVLHHLREIERRRLFSALGFSSLFAYARKSLGYSEDQACRLIAAARQLAEMPDLEEKISTGALTLTTISLARSAFRQSTKTPEEKREIFSSLENTSTRDAEKILSTHFPERKPKDKIRATSPEEVSITFTAPAEIEGMIEEWRGLMAHKYPGESLGALMKEALALAIATVKDQKTQKTRKTRETRNTQKTNDQNTQSPAAPRVESLAAIRREIRMRADHKCENCSSKQALEIDHIFPKALGGKDTLDNLRLLCRSCNQRAAIDAFGQDAMDPFLGKG